MSDAALEQSEKPVIQRPTTAIDTVFALFEPLAHPIILNRGQKLCFGEMNGFLYLFKSGRISLVRTEDDLYLGNTAEKSLLGLINYYHPLNHYYYQAEADCSLACIPFSVAFDLVKQHNLWEQIIQILSWNFFMILKRDNRLTGHNAYTAIRRLLLELMQLPEHIRQQLPLANYIQKYTRLSRSQVMRILKELKEGHYIETARGKLITVHRLPDKF